MAEQMEALQLMFTQSDVSRSMVDDKLGQLAGSIDRMTQRMEDSSTTTDALMRVAHGQEQLIGMLGQTGTMGDGRSAGKGSVTSATWVKDGCGFSA